MPATPLPREVDVAIIGAGTAGLAAYRTAKAAGCSVALIDHGPLGTLCARTGCMPSKATLHAAQRWSTARPLADWTPSRAEAVRARLWTEMRTSRDRVAEAAADKARDETGGDLAMGRARFAAPDAIDVTNDEAATRIRAKAFVVATGSHPVVPAPFAALGALMLTTDSLFDLDALPASIGVVGLGNVGIEMGVALARFGLEVEGFDTAVVPGGLHDPEVARRAIERLSRELPMSFGTEVHPRAVGGGVELTSDRRTARFDRVLVCLGRAPNLDDLGLDAAGVSWPHDEHAPIDLETLRLADAPIFVAGDAAADRPLQHEAADEGTIAARHACALVHGEPIDSARRHVPLSIVFTDPDLCAIGERFDRIDASRMVVGSGSSDSNGRSTLLGEDRNVVRLYVARRERTLAGASVFSTRGEHLAHWIALAIAREATVDDLLATPFYHPTIEEIVETALEDAIEQLGDGR